MDLVYLQEFVEFSECMSVSQAAKHLYLSKSALSKHLSVLEREFGAQLFTRDARPCLTQAGNLLLAYGNEVLSAYGKALDAVSSLAPESELLQAG